MKKVCIALLMVACVALGACAAPHRGGEFAVGSDVVPLPEATPQPTLPAPPTPALPTSAHVAASAYRPEAVPTALAGSENFSTALYVLLTEGIRAGDGDVDASTLEVTQAQFDGVRAYLLSRNPWGTLTDITLDDVEPGRIVLTYALDDPDECAAQAQRFDDAAAAAIAACVPENATQLSASISLYKFVAQTVTQNYEDENFEAADSGLYSALVDGQGMDRSFAYLYSFLLDQVGVQNEVVVCETGEHAWNLLTIDGRSFYCDPQMEAGLNGGQALQGFGLSGTDMAALNGWQTWHPESTADSESTADPESGADSESTVDPESGADAEAVATEAEAAATETAAPETGAGSGAATGAGAAMPETETLLSPVRQANFADIDPTADAIYFDLMDGRAGIYRMDLATGEVLDVIEAEPLALAVLGENVYYLDSADNLLYSYHTADGTILQAVEGVPMRSLRRVNTELRYVTQEDAEGLLSLN